MPNKNYLKGRRKEYAVCDKLKKEGFDIVQRSKGSHSPIDVFAINKETKEIKLVQVKPDQISDSETQKIIKDNFDLSGAYSVGFAVM
jgi:Holliday junction resolvase